LDDFDWQNETLLRRAKQGRVQQFPIQYEIGQAIIRLSASRAATLFMSKSLCDHGISLSTVGKFGSPGSQADARRPGSLRKVTALTHCGILALLSSCEKRLCCAVSPTFWDIETSASSVFLKSMTVTLVLFGVRLSFIEFLDVLLRRAAGENTIHLGNLMGDNPSSQASLSDIEAASARIFDDFQGCPEVLDSVAVLFRETYPLDVRSLRSALTVRDSAKIAFLAHKMRGSVLCLHQEGAARIAAALEEKAARDDLEGTDRLIESLTQTYELVCSSLERAGQMLVESAADQDS
jgi:hypothetical protein